MLLDTMLGSPYLTSNIMQTAPAQNVVSLTELSNIERTDLKPYCLLLEAQQKRYFLSLKNDEELYNWQDDIYSRSPLSGVSNPTNFVHKVHVGFDPVSGAFTVSTVSRTMRSGRRLRSVRRLHRHLVASHCPVSGIIPSARH